MSNDKTGASGINPRVAMGSIIIKHIYDHPGTLLDQIGRACNVVVIILIRTYSAWCIKKSIEIISLNLPTEKNLHRKFYSCT